MVEIETVWGEIQNIKPKAIAINNDWYSSFNEIKGYKKGQVVTIKFTKNTKDGKTYRNIKSIELLGEVIEEKKESNNVKEIISDTTINTVLMISKDIYIEQVKAYKGELVPFFEEVLEEVFDAYNKVIRGKK